MLVVTKLRCEYLKNPIGIGCVNPHFSWQISSNKKNIMQQQFQLQVALDEEFTRIIWNVHTFSGESTNIRYEGPTLESKKRYFYRVKVWTTEVAVSEWSEVAFWEMGLLDSSEWKAQWITVKAPKVNDENGCRSPFSCFKEFSLKKSIQKAVIYATSLGLYELKLNGQKVGEDYFTPGWTDYNYRLQYQTYDVTEMISKEVNTLFATVGEGWYSGYLGWNNRKDIYGNTNALLAQLLLTYEDGTTEIICTDGTWQEKTCKILMSDIYKGEILDASKETNIEGNMLVLDYPKKQLIAQENEPVRIMTELEPIAIIMTPKGETVLDMGQNMVGWVRCKVNGVRGQTLTLVHGEVLDPDGNFYRDNIRSADQKVTYICKGNKEEVLEPHFTFQGFRYVKLEGFSKNIKISDFKGIVFHSNMERTGTFETSDNRINQLQSNILWGQKGNFLDVPTDCPQRDERLGWTGDAQIFARTACYNMNTALFFRKWLKDLSYNQMPDGAVSVVVPDVLKGGFIDTVTKTTAGWGDAAVICPWTIYLCYGDTNVLRDQYSSMKKWIDYIRAQGKDEYLWDTGVQLADWVALDSAEGSYYGATDGYLVATAFYAYSTEIFSRVAKILGYYDDYKTYKDLYTRIKQAYAERFFDKEGHLISATQTAQAISLHFNLVPDPYKKQVSKKLVTLIEDNEMHLTTGFIGTPYICHALSSNGYMDVAYHLLFQPEYPSWLYQVGQGATTMWEHWDGIKPDGSLWSSDMNSFNHYAYGSIGDWMYQSITGIDILEAGYKKTSIAPQPTKRLSYAKATLETPYGKLHSSWKVEQGMMQLNVRIPHNTTAVIKLPYVEDKTSLKQDICNFYPEIKFSFQEETEDNLIFEVGSGSFHFIYKYSNNYR